MHIPEVSGPPLTFPQGLLASTPQPGGDCSQIQDGMQPHTPALGRHTPQAHLRAIPAHTPTLSRPAQEPVPPRLKQ